MVTFTDNDRDWWPRPPSLTHRSSVLRFSLEGTGCLFFALNFGVYSVNFQTLWIYFGLFHHFIMSDYVATPSSDDNNDTDARRNCSMCSNRMSSKRHDKHSLCVTCRGGECSFGNKCQECLKWSKEEFDKYIKHRKALES